MFDDAIGSCLSKMLPKSLTMSTLKREPLATMDGMVHERIIALYHTALFFQLLSAIFLLLCLICIGFVSYNPSAGSRSNTTGVLISHSILWDFCQYSFLVEC